MVLYRALELGDTGGSSFSTISVKPDNCCDTVYELYCNQSRRKFLESHYFKKLTYEADDSLVRVKPELVIQYINDFTRFGAITVEWDDSDVVGNAFDLVVNEYLSDGSVHKHTVYSSKGFDDVELIKYKTLNMNCLCKQVYNYALETSYIHRHITHYDHNHRSPKDFVVRGDLDFIWNSEQLAFLKTHGFRSDDLREFEDFRFVNDFFFLSCLD